MFSAGGDPGEYTIPNFLSTFTDLRGAPRGVTLPRSTGKRLDKAVRYCLFKLILESAEFDFFLNKKGEWSQNPRFTQPSDKLDTLVEYKAL